MGAELSETGERGVGADGNWEFVLRGRVGQREGLEDGIRAVHGLEEGGGVGALEVEGWVGGRDGAVLCMGEDEILGCRNSQ